MMRFCSIVLRVADLDRSINFYTNLFGMKLFGAVRNVTNSNEETVSMALIGYKINEGAIEFLQNHRVWNGITHTDIDPSKYQEYGQTPYGNGTDYDTAMPGGFGQIILASTDVHGILARQEEFGFPIIRNFKPAANNTRPFVMIKDPDGYTIQIKQADEDMTWWSNIKPEGWYDRYLEEHTPPKFIRKVTYGRQDSKLEQYGNFIQLGMSVKAWLRFYADEQGHGKGYRILNESMDGNSLVLEVEFNDIEDAKLFSKNWEEDIPHYFV